MGKAAKSTKSRDRVRAHRDRLRKQGLRPIQIWVPDVTTPEFVAEAHRQSLVVANSTTEQEDQDFVDAVSDWEGMPEWRDR
jgi:surfactin synthase thioesterase subunit